MVEHIADGPGATSARVAVAAPNALASRAGADIGALGGTAVDAAIAALMVTMVSEPGIVSLASGAFVTVAPAGGAPATTIDGYVEMPGRGLPPEAFGRGVREAEIAYGGRTTMTIGHGSAATPGVLAACELAHRLHGSFPWRAVVEPAVEVARAGSPLGAASDYFFEFSREVIFGGDAAIRAALHHPDGRPIRAGETIWIADLADFVERIAAEGADALYRSEVADRLAADMAANGGLITRADLEAYQPVLRPSVEIDLGDWRLATNPPPAIGGPVLAAMLLLLASDWPGDPVARMIAVQRAVLGFRATQMDPAEDLAAAAQALLDGVVAGGQSWMTAAPSTAHVSAVDVDGGACAITASSGYGAGVTIPGTGVWLNNCLGEHELNRAGLHSLQPGQRLASNMAPSVGRTSDGAVLAIGSPGAARITTALAQVIVALAQRGLDLQAAIDAPRVHVRRSPGGAEAIEHEADLDIGPLPGVDLPRIVHAAQSMYFGGVAAAMRRPNGALVAAADPRRGGVTAFG